jgi:hypothetical protein
MSRWNWKKELEAFREDIDRNGYSDFIAEKMSKVFFQYLIENISDDLFAVGGLTDSSEFRR